MSEEAPSELREAIESLVTEHASTHETQVALAERFDRLSLPEGSKDYIHRILEESGEDEELLGILQGIATDIQKHDRKCMERLRMKQLDMVERMSIYSEAQTNLLMPHVFCMQLTDGCLGACNFCGIAETIRSLSECYSLDSFTTYTQMYGKKFGSKVYPYLGSDPFEVMDAKHTFISWAGVFHKNAPQTELSITTSVPGGTELAVAEFLEYYLAAQRGDTPLNADVRISVRDENRSRVENVIGLLKKRGYTEEELEIIELREIKKPFHIGKMVTHPDRKLYSETGSLNLGELLGIQCEEGVVLTTESVPGKSLLFEIVTPENPSGWRRRDINPNDMEFPPHKTLLDYGYLNMRLKLKPVTLFSMALETDVPPALLVHCDRNGNVTRSTRFDSAERVAYSLLLRLSTLGRAKDLLEPNSQLPPESEIQQMEQVLDETFQTRLGSIENPNVETIAIIQNALAEIRNILDVLRPR